MFGTQTKIQIQRTGLAGLQGFVGNFKGLSELDTRAAQCSGLIFLQKTAFFFKKAIFKVKK